jgi:hypothetical protein
VNQAVHVFADEVPVRFKTQYLETGRVAKIAVAVLVDSVYTLSGGVEEEVNLLLPLPFQAFGLLNYRKVLDF